MKTRTIISHIPSKPKKKPNRRKKVALWVGFFKIGKYFLLLGLIVVYLVYTNQASTLGYTLRKSLRELEVTQEQLDVLQLEVSRKEQALRSQVERTPNQKQTKKMIVP